MNEQNQIKGESINQKIQPRDRVINAINHKESDICPYYIWIHSDMVQPLAEHYGDPEFQTNYICNHSVMEDLQALERPISDDRFVDEFGCEWRQGAALHIESPPLKEPSLKGYKFPDMSAPEHFNGLDTWLDENAHRFKVVQLGMMFFERTWSLRGFENILMDFYLNPSFVEELLEELESVCNSMIDYLIKNFGDKIDAIGFSDDYGGEQSMLISPDLWKKFIAPHTKRMYQRIRDGGKYVYLHSCGHVTPIIPDLIEMGVDILQPLQPEAMDIFELKRNFGQDLCLYGGISTQQTLPFGTVDDVIEEVHACLQRMARGGGYIMAPAKPIMPGVPLENAVALIDSFVNQGK